MAKKSTTKNECAVPAMDQSWRARDDADTLRRAGEIMGDKGRVKAAKGELLKSVAAIQRVTAAPAVKPSPNPRGLGFANPKGKR